MHKTMAEELRRSSGGARVPLRRFSSDQAFVFECHPAILRVGHEWLCAWLQCRSGSDVVVAKWLDSPDAPTVLSSPGATAGPPQLSRAGGDMNQGREAPDFVSPDQGTGGSVLCVWESCRDREWSVEGKRMVEGVWAEDVHIAKSGQKFDPTLGCAADGHVWCAWVELEGQARRLRAADIDAASPQVIDVPTGGRACYRPRLTRAGQTLWLTWESYEEGGYRVCACAVPHRPGVQPPSAGGGYRGALDRVHVVSSGPAWDVLHTAGTDAAGRLWVAWVHSQDVQDERGVVDQWQSIEAARLDASEWTRLPRVADLCHGLLPKTAVWGYCGRRRHPMLVADRERVWVVWERKDQHDNGTWKATGVLCGKSFDGERWSAERELCRGLVSYVVDAHARDSRATFSARDMMAGATWDSGVPNVLEWVWGNLGLGEAALSHAAPEFPTEEWTGWAPVVLSRVRKAKPRFERDGLTLFWGDPHVHTAQSGDAEGEVDELMRYAREKARLDFCAIADNDVYCFPLTDHEWARQQRLIVEHSQPGQFVIIPLYEWSWADPENRRPNHRLVMFSQLHEPLWRHIDPEGRDIDSLAKSIEGTSGLLIGHHLGWVFADSAAEAAIEIVSAWAPHMVLKPDFIHDTLNTGRRLAFTGGTDSHRRNPGYCGALTGIYATELTAAALVEGVRCRRTVATTGCMIALDLRVGGAFIGDNLQCAGPQPVHVRVRAPREIESVAVVRDGEVIREQTNVNATESEMMFTDAPSPGWHWYYARAKLRGEVPHLPSNVVVAQGNHAWTSPVWVEVGT